ncbi:MAG: histidine kinase [Alteromonadaceae bacterium]|nr:MAG: histidine kinase [Alteromonadaceae bacterium]
MEPIAKKVAVAIVKAIKNDELILPTMPEMAIKVRDIAEDQDASIAQLNTVISSDAALTARIIKVANSPLFRAPRQIEDLSMALSRLGMQTTANLAMGLAMEQMFQATSDIVDKRMREVWTKSSEIAGICHVLCKHYTKLRPDSAALAGLVHQIGILPILSYAEDNPTLLRDSFTLDSVIRQIHPAIGVKILTTWEFPPEIQKIPMLCRDYKRKVATADYSDLVTVATLQCNAESEENQKLDYGTITAFERLGLDPNIDSADAEDLSEDMEAAMAMLQ